MAEESIFKALAFKIIFYEQFLTCVVWEVFCRVDTELRHCDSDSHCNTEAQNSEQSGAVHTS